MYYAYTRVKAVFIILPVTLFLISCSSSSEIAVYDSVPTEKPLIVPPDIALPRQNKALTVPEIAPQSTTYKIYSRKTSKGVDELLKVRTTGIRLVRDGAIRWLEIDAKPKDIWSKAIHFFEQTGFDIKVKKPKLGIIETDWLENRANIPTNWFSQMLRSSGQQDKYRVRLERNNKNTRTLLFLTHQGAVEKETEFEEDAESEKYWVLRDSDPELEAEMLQRFLVYLGNDKSEITKVFDDSKQQKRTSLIKADGKVIALNVNEIFSRTWRRTGLAIDRLGFTVDDKNRSAGIYYIKLSKSFIESEMKNAGFFSTLFSDKKQSITQFIISLEEKKGITQIRILTRQGDENKSPLQQRILEKLDKLLK